MAYTFILTERPNPANLRQRARPRLYASSNVHAFVNLWPQQAGLAP